MKRMRYAFLALAILIGALYATDYIGIISYNDGGRVLGLLIFGNEIMLIDEPAEARRKGGE